jgi:hypothetical protein
MGGDTGIKTDTSSREKWRQRHNIKRILENGEGALAPHISILHPDETVCTVSFQ